MNYREKIRKAIECSQFGSARYGEWSMLNFDQRKSIKRLLDELDRADAYIVKMYKEKQKLQKYKSLYENEKDHTDTLKRIVKEVKENLERHLTAKAYSNHKYELFGREYLEEILDLLKEIK